MPLVGSIDDLIKMHMLDAALVKPMVALCIHHFWKLYGCSRREVLEKGDLAEQLAKQLRFSK
jgi:hypothetical protein